MEQIRRYIKREYVHELIVKNNGQIEHDECIGHCLPFTFESIVKEKQLLENKKEKLLHYLAHQARKTYLNIQVQANLLKLDKDRTILIVDYKMRILPKSAQETKSKFFEKKGWTLYSILMYTKQENNGKLNIAAFDHWSTDTKQDTWFTASSLHAVFEIMFNKPKWIILISDNGPHYHNTEMMLIGKNSMILNLSVYPIKRYVRIGFEIKEGNYIEKAIKIKSLVGISNLNEWKWPIESPFAGYIQARPLPKIGNYINYSPAQIEKLPKSETIKPKPTLSTPTNSQSTWIVPISNFDTNSKRTKIDTLSNENHEGNINRFIDIEFQLMSGWALKANQKFGKRELNDMATSGELDPEIIPKVETIENWIGRYSAACKREMAAIVLERQEQMNCDITGLYRFTEIFSRTNFFIRKKLNDMATSGELDPEIIPKVETIENWIGRYSAACKREMAAIVLERQEQMNCDISK
ncbi:hypothetical protein Glove_240g36 [Diversispora epigaea]|uniref:Uncharacterized protein n=1 Tax=Diversispora epigaea TaxID=1348612 RepID=A0A397ICU2_9GLOM|nr:hypothetical protein Glove_240g36 [Diversispora epigaea]